MRLFWLACGCGLLTTWLGACRAPDREVLDEAAVVAAIEERPDEVARVLAETLDESGLSVVWSAWPAISPAHREAAVAHAPAVRAARRELSARRWEVASSGRPGAVGLEAGFEDAGAPGDAAVGLSFDLIGLIGAEPRMAARALASSRVHEAVGSLESSVWQAAHEADRRVVRAAAASWRVEVLEELLARVRMDRSRLEGLVLVDGSSRGVVSRARSVLLEVEISLEQAQKELASARAALAVAVGRHADDQLVTGVGRGTLERVQTDLLATSVQGEPQSLLTRHPALRRARLAHALAEARLRVAAASRWPELRLGPTFDFARSDSLPGALLEIACPWPGSVDGEIEAARERRRAARERLEDAWLSWIATRDAAGKRLARDRRLVREVAPASDAASATAFRVASARLRVDRQGVGAWADALEARLAGALAPVEAALAAAEAAIDLREAGGLPVGAAAPPMARGQRDE